MHTAGMMWRRARRVGLVLLGCVVALAPSAGWSAEKEGEKLIDELIAHQKEYAVQVKALAGEAGKKFSGDGESIDLAAVTNLLKDRLALTRFFAEDSWRELKEKVSSFLRRLDKDVGPVFSSKEYQKAADEFAEEITKDYSR